MLVLYHEQRSQQHQSDSHSFESSQSHVVILIT
ncbi:hypothetical protein RB213_000385 [Colletotrichum asianum]